MSNFVFTMSSLMFMAVDSVALTIIPSLSFTKGMLELFVVLNIKLLGEKKLSHSVESLF